MGHGCSRVDVSRETSGGPSPLGRVAPSESRRRSLRRSRLFSRGFRLTVIPSGTTPRGISMSHGRTRKSTEWMVHAMISYGFRVHPCFSVAQFARSVDLEIFALRQILMVTKAPRAILSCTTSSQPHCSAWEASSRRLHAAQPIGRIWPPPTTVSETTQNLTTSGGHGSSSGSLVSASRISRNKPGVALRSGFQYRIQFRGGMLLRAWLTKGAAPRSSVRAPPWRHPGVMTPCFT